MRSRPAGYSFPVMWNDWTIGSFKRRLPLHRELGQAMARFAVNPGDARPRRPREEPAMIGRTRTTCVARCSPAVMRTTPCPSPRRPRSIAGSSRTSVAEVRDSLQQVVGNRSRWRCSASRIPARRPRCAVTCWRRDQGGPGGHPGVPIVPDMAPYATDGSIFRVRAFQRTASAACS